MKKLLKSKVYGSRKQCMDALFTGEKSTTVAKKKMWKHRRGRESKHSLKVDFFYYKNLQISEKLRTN